MSCKVCGRPRGQGHFVTLAFGVVRERVCWTCRYWLDTGKVYDVR